MRRRRARSGDDDGVVLVWFALTMAVLLGCAALAVDVGHWYLVANRVQKRADAAALAGAVYLPNDPTKAIATARAIAADNRDDANTRITVSPAVGDMPNQLKVTATETIDNYFGSVFGRRTQAVSRTAVAEYDPPVAMGSPSNQLGNDPESSAAPGTPKFPNLWGNIAGPDSPKVNGDAYQARGCTSSPDNCPGTNTDYDTHGYYYTVRVAAGYSGPLVIQVFDPAFVAVGDTCGNNDDSSNLAGAAALPPGFNPLYPGTIPPSVRYHPVANAADPSDPGMRWCTGDHIFDSGPAPATTYRVLGPVKIPGDTSSAPPDPICEKTFPGVHGDLASLLRSTTPVGSAPDALVAYFRQWYTLCSFSGGPGDYFVQVSTTGSSGSGHNRFALRVGDGTCTTCFDTNQLSLFANARMSIYANVGNNTLTSFHLARLVPGGKGRTLVLNLYDIGDAQGTGTLTIVPPPDSGASFRDCSYTAPKGNSTGPPWGTFTQISGCAITGVNHAQYDGQWIQVRVTVPDNYTCSTNDPTACWVRINYLFNSTIQDTTSWTAYVEGDPVRLVK